MRTRSICAIVSLMPALLASGDCWVWGPEQYPCSSLGTQECYEVCVENPFPARPPVGCFYEEIHQVPARSAVLLPVQGAAQTKVISMTCATERICVVSNNICPESEVSATLYYCMPSGEVEDHVVPRTVPNFEFACSTE